MFVIKYLQREGGLLLSAQLPPIAMQRFISELPELQTAPAPAKEKANKKDSAYEDVLQEFPWLICLDRTEAFEAPGDTPGSASADSDAQPGGQRTEKLGELDENDMQVLALAALEAARASSGGPGPRLPTEEDFYIKIRGDSLGQREKQKGADALQAVASKFGTAFCRRRSLQITFRAGFGDMGSLSPRLRHFS